MGLGTDCGMARTLWLYPPKGIWAFEKEDGYFSGPNPDNFQLYILHSEQEVGHVHGLYPVVIPTKLGFGPLSKKKSILLAPTQTISN